MWISLKALTKKKKKKNDLTRGQDQSFKFHDNFQENQIIKWAAAWQNQQNDYVPSKDSDQPGNLPSLISLRNLRSLANHWVHSEDSGSGSAAVQAALSVHWAHMPFCSFVMQWLKLSWLARNRKIEIEKKN